MWELFLLYMLIAALCGGIGGNGKGLTDAEVEEYRERAKNQHRGLVGPWYKPKKETDK